MTNDQEIEALQKCNEALRDLDDEAKTRVIQYLINKFKLSSGYANYQSKPAIAGTAQIIPNNGTATVADVTSRVSNSHYPSLKDIVIKNLPKSEVEWILVYSFYSSEFGAKEFTKEDLLSVYEQSKRLTENARKNFNHNLKSAVKKDWIMSTNETDYIMLEAGSIYANEILTGKSTTKQRKPSKRKKISAKDDSSAG